MARGSSNAHGIAFGGLLGSGGADWAAFCDDGSFMCSVRRMAALLQSFLLIAIILGIVVWAFNNRKQLLRTVGFK